MSVDKKSIFNLCSWVGVVCP